MYLQAIVSAFVAPELFRRVHAECRAPLFGSLVKALGTEVLPCIVASLLAVNAAAASKARAGEEEHASDAAAQEAAEFLRALCSASGPREQVCGEVYINTPYSMCFQEVARTLIYIEVLQKYMTTPVQHGMTLDFLCIALVCALGSASEPREQVRGVVVHIITRYSSWCICTFLYTR